jgi:subtilisin
MAPLHRRSQQGTDDKYFELKRGSGSNFAVSDADKVHTIAAPMVCIYSTAPAGGYATLKWGTSYASPHAAGTVALCVGNGACAGLTPPQIIQKLRADADAYTRANPSWGFAGDPTRPVTGRYYGFLTRAAGY